MDKKNEIIVKGKFITIEHIAELIDKFNKIKTDNYPKLSIIAKDKITEFNTLLINCFILLKKQQPKLDITVNLAKNKF